MKPLIGLTSVYFPRERGDYDTLNRGYSQSVAAAGGLPVLLPVGTPAEALDRLDALILTGGSDVGPRHYGEEPHPKLGPVDSRRDEWELTLARACRVPLLGICRGHQLLNVALGGTLYQDLESQFPSAVGHSQAGDPMDELHHTVALEPGSRLARVFPELTMLTNSFHHQAVKTLAPGLRETGRALDGLNEAYEEDPSGPHAGRWLMGVQFHPETLGERYPQFIEIFRLLVERSRKP